MIQITPTLFLNADEISERFVRSSGPGGQNVNKVATAVVLRFDVRNSPSLPREVANRLTTLAGRKINADGVLTIKADRFRTQPQNRQDAMDRLIAMIRRAAVKPPQRRPTRLPRSVKARILDSKRRRGNLKHLRRKVKSLSDM